MIKKILLVSTILIAGITLSGCENFDLFNHQEAPAPTSTAAAPASEATPAEKPKPEYRTADRQPPAYNLLRRKCVEVDGHRTCGYDCKVLGNEAKCAEEPKQRCIISPSNQIVCGYDCKATSLTAECGEYLYDNCVTNTRGEIKCGNNCKLRDDDEIVCGK